MLKTVESVSVREQFTAFYRTTKVRVPKAPTRDPADGEQDPIAKSFAALEVDKFPTTKRSGKRGGDNADVLERGPDAKSLKTKLPKSFEVSADMSESSDGSSDPFENIEAPITHPKSKLSDDPDDDQEDDPLIPKPLPAKSKAKPLAKAKPLPAVAETPKRRGEWWLTRTGCIARCRGCDTKVNPYEFRLIPCPQHAAALDAKAPSYVYMAKKIDHRYHHVWPLHGACNHRPNGL